MSGDFPFSYTVAHFNTQKRLLATDAACMRMKGCSRQGALSMYAKVKWPHDGGGRRSEGI